MTAAGQRSGWSFWLVVAILVVAPLGTCVVVGVENWTHYQPDAVVTAQTAPSGAAVVTNAKIKAEGRRICAVYRGLAHKLDPKALEDGTAIWKALGSARPPKDPWGRPYEWQPWDRSIRSYGPDRKRGTPDDQIYHCQ